MKLNSIINEELVFCGVEGSSREEDNYGAEVRYNFSARRWLDLGAGYRYEDRNSDLDFYSYTENVFFLDARLSL